jgi:enamine deaminase RidA (YjgF/YER057c/UK114 family)
MSDRRSIDIEGFNHGGYPIPAAARVGPLLMTSGVHGMDPGTGKLAEDVRQQTKQMFDNLRRIMTAAGGALDEIAQLTIHVDVPAARAAVEEEWIRAFPDPASRPARYTVINENLPGAVVVQCEATAWIDQA